MDVQTARHNIRDHLLLLRELGFLCLEPAARSTPEDAEGTGPEESPIRATANPEGGAGGVSTAVPTAVSTASAAVPIVAAGSMGHSVATDSLPPGGPLSGRAGWPGGLFCQPPGAPLVVVHPPFGVSATLDAIDVDELVKYPGGSGAPGSSGRGARAAEAETPDLFGEPQTPPPNAPRQTDQTDRTDQTGRTDGAGSAVNSAGPAAAPPESTATPSLSREERVAALSAIAHEVALCRNCRLVGCRTNVVPGQGNPEARIVFVGEGPGETEDQRGLAFVGKAGRLLTDMIHAMGLTREDVFICNVVKCRPPENRNPEPDEMAACEPFLKRQLEILRPTVIVALGAVALKCLLGDPKLSITRIRGNWRTYESIPLMPTFHPSYLLRMPSEKVKAWEDLKKVMRVFGLEPKSGKRGTPA